MSTAMLGVRALATSQPAIAGQKAHHKEYTPSIRKIECIHEAQISNKRRWKTTHTKLPRRICREELQEKIFVNSSQDTL